MSQFIDVLVFDTLADWEIGHALAHLNDPRWQARPGRFIVRTIGLSPAPVRTAGGLTILPDATVDVLDPAHSALLMLPGGSAWDRGLLDDVLPLVSDWLDASVPVAAICGATAGLARAGLLNTRAHTSNASQYLQFQPGYEGAGNYQSVPAVEAGGLITAGSLAPIEFAYQIFKVLDLYAPDTLEAWRQLFVTRDPQYYFALEKSVEPVATQT